jgi:hypothetical protein
MVNKVNFGLIMGIAGGMCVADDSGAAATAPTQVRSIECILRLSLQVPGVDTDATGGLCF